MNSSFGTRGPTAGYSIPGVKITQCQNFQYRSRQLCAVLRAIQVEKQYLNVEQQKFYMLDSLEIKLVASLKQTAGPMCGILEPCPLDRVA